MLRDVHPQVLTHQPQIRGGVLRVVQRRKLKLKAKLKQNESSLSYFGYKRLAPGGFYMGLIGSTCTVLPCVGQGDLNLKVEAARAE